jgi:uncharacterized protein YbjT (DUF2867 family)
MRIGPVPPCNNPGRPESNKLTRFPQKILKPHFQETIMSKKIIAVVGSTGAQGGGLVRAILAEKQGKFTPRAITRNPSSDKAKALAALGVEVVQADLDDVTSLTAAFKGSYGAFCVTNFWEHLSPDKERIQAGNQATAAKAAGIQHILWSTLEDTRTKVPLSDNRMPTLMGKYKVPHFDVKGEANALFTATGVPTTFLNTSFYWENFIHFGLGPKKGPDGKYAITLPIGEKKLPGIAAEDIGKCALGIFQADPAYFGKTIGIAGGHLTGKEMAQKMGQALGIEVVFNAVPPDVYRKFGFPGADEMGNMFQYKSDFESSYCGARSLSGSRELNPELQTFDQWLAKNKSAIPLG